VIAHPDTVMWLLVGNAVLLATTILVSVVELRVLRRNRRRNNALRRVLVMLALHVQTHVGHALPFEVQTFVRDTEPPARRRRRAI
jgi:Flp pilus assembly protein TadB